MFSIATRRTSPRELQDNGFAVGRRRTARLMHENGLKVREAAVQKDD
jgi:hypothetical protein